MRKLKLKVDDLQVDSFATAPVSAEGGTVRGWAVTPDVRIPPTDGCPPDGGATAGTCIGPTYCCGATGPTNPVCIGPTYCCNPTANTGCCPPPTGTCPGTAYVNTCNLSCYPADCIP
ncbi:hypothetical protein [Longimicrobium sp.]|uniref:hypothetical protein n=1 Tax=Longimicrobium sp. TaxID=2029185 RepID=UPI002E31F179|nr:hypothetical protein [Longimicrobium sp.]HEX6039151.1 hypothetical protein [Longimicrobium sp.]